MFGFIRCEDMVDVRRLKMLQMVQLFKCEEDAAQVRTPFLEDEFYLTIKKSMYFMILRRETH